MDDRRIALLNAARDAESTRRNFRRELDADLAEFHCPSGEIPGGFRYDGFVVTGSWASVYWDREWIGRLKGWVGDAIESWEALAGDAEPDPATSRRIEEARGAPSTPGWDDV
jgi:GMP synthase (glutamine-hydrolysing)